MWIPAFDTMTVATIRLLPRRDDETTIVMIYALTHKSQAENKITWMEPNVGADLVPVLIDIVSSERTGTRPVPTTVSFPQ